MRLSEADPLLVLANVGQSFGTNTLFKNLSLALPSRAIVAIAGPSGVGKSSLLRIIAGLDEPHAGRIYLEGQDITNALPSNRNVSFLFQQPVLYDHLTVYDNIAFPLRLQGATKGGARNTIEELAGTLRIAHLLKRSPRNLSGGEIQRVGLARAFASCKAIRLLDEPLKSALEPALRDELRIRIRELHDQRSGLTIIVTHDQQEALEIADYLIVMLPGWVSGIIQTRQAYESPENLELAKFIGGGSVFLATMPLSDHLVTVSGTHLRVVGSKLEPPSGPQTWLIRPSSIAIAKGGSFRVSSTRYHGSVYYAEFESADKETRLAGYLDSDSSVGRGAKCDLELNTRGLHAFDSNGKSSLQDSWTTTYSSLLRAACDSDAFHYAMDTLRLTLADIGFSPPFILHLISLIQSLSKSRSRKANSFLRRLDQFRSQWSEELFQVYSRSYEFCRHSFFSTHLGPLLKSIRPQEILDLGCGKGSSSQWLRQQFPRAHVWGVDIESFDSEWRKATALDSLLHFRQLEPSLLGEWLTDHPQISLVTAFWVFHHSDNQALAETLGSLASGLRPSSRLLLLEDSHPLSGEPAVDPHGLWSSFKSLDQISQWSAQAVLDFVAVRLLAGLGTVDMTFNYRPAEDWVKYFNSFGFREEARSFIGFPGNRDIAVPQLASLFRH